MNFFMKCGNDISFSRIICVFSCFVIDWLICCFLSIIHFEHFAISVYTENMNNNNGVVGGRIKIYFTTLVQIIHELNHIVTSSIKTCCWN